MYKFLYNISFTNNSVAYNIGAYIGFSDLLLSDPVVAGFKLWLVCFSVGPDKSGRSRRTRQTLFYFIC